MNKFSEKKVLYALAIGLVAIAIAYYVGKELGRYLKNNEAKDVSIEIRK